MKAIVIGAGATGLALGYILARSGVEVVLVEATARPGGLLATFDPGGGDPLECFYHHAFAHDAELRWLLSELGILDRLEYWPASMGVFRSGRLYDFNGPADLLRFDAIGLSARLRFGVSSALMVLQRGLVQREDVSALGWFRRWAGEEATDAVWRPLLEAKFGDAAARVPLAWMAGRLRQRALSRKGGLQERLGYLRGSTQVLVDALAGALQKLGTRLDVSTRVTAVRCQGGRATGVETTEGPLNADLVFGTIASPLLGGLVRHIAVDYARELEATEHLGAICTVLSTREPLTHIYWINVADAGYDFGGVIEHTNLLPPDRYGGQHLTYLSRYTQPNDSLWSLADGEIVARQTAQLERLTHRRLQPEVQRHWVFRARYAAPLTDVGFRRRIPAYRSPIDGLFVGNMCHIYPDERSMNNSIRVAAELAKAAGFGGIAAGIPRGAGLAGRYG